MILDTYRRRRREYLADQAEVDALTDAWRSACEGTGLSRPVQTVTGVTMVSPRLVFIVLGPPTVLTVELLPGMVAGDVRVVATRLAPHLGAVMIRVQPRGLRYVVIRLLDRDPLADLVPFRFLSDGLALVGRTEDGSELAEDWRRQAHTIVQGVTRSGKSVWTYGFLASVARLSHVVVAGVDPTGLLFRPFEGSRHAEWQAAGLADLGELEKVLSRLVDEMDRRIAGLPLDRDTIEVSPERPLLVVVLEEYAGLLRALDAAKTKGDDPGARVRALVGRLLAEGAKAGVRVLILVQRAEAAVVGAFERAMCSLRISFRTDNRASVELLHPGADPLIADQHTTADVGIALMSAPGRPLTRIRAPYIGGYPEYVKAIRTTR